MTRAALPSLVAIALAAGTAAAAPAFPFDELVRRSETIFVGELVAGDAATLTFEPRAVLRGKPAASLRFDFDARADGALPDKVTRYVVISQGDDYWGKPTTRARLGQGTHGQASFRGWIVLPIANGEVVGAFRVDERRGFVALTLADVRATVARSPYRARR